MMNLLKVTGRAGSQKRLLYYSFAAFNFSETKNYYKILEVSPSASQSEIKSSFYRLAKLYHPDVSKHTTEKFKEINEAYETLGDEFKKRVYDQQIKQREQQINQREQQKTYSRYQSSQNYSKNQDYRSQTQKNDPNSEYFDEIFNERMRSYEQRMKRAKYYEDFQKYSQQKQYEDMDKEYNDFNSYNSMIVKKFISFGLLLVLLSSLLFLIPQQAASPPYYTIYDKKEKIAYILSPQEYMRWKAEGQPPLAEFAKPKLAQKIPKKRIDLNRAPSNFPPELEQRLRTESLFNKAI